MGLMKLVKKQGERAAARVRNALRGLLSGLRTDTEIQFVQVKALAGETLQDVELFQHFGFTSGPPADTQLILLPLGGKSTHNVIVATENGVYRIKVEQGETSVYNQWGAQITLKKERLIHMVCDDFVGDIKNRWQVNCTKSEVNCQQAETTAQTIQQTASAQANYNSPALTFGGKEGETATATMNANINQLGWHHSTGDQVAGSISQQGHTHRGDSGGTTGPPQ